MSKRDNIFSAIYDRISSLFKASGQAQAPSENEVLIASSYIGYPQSTKSTPTQKNEAALFNSYLNWTYICISKIAKTVSMLPLQLYAYKSTNDGKYVNGKSIKYAMINDKVDRGNKMEVARYLKQAQVERVRILEHPFLTLLQNPNPGMVRFTLWYNILIRMELLGYCGIWLPRGRLGLPAEMWPLPLTKTAKLEAVASKKVYIDYWQYRDGDVILKLLPEELLFIAYPDPRSPFAGKSPVEAQAYPYDIYSYMLDQQNAIYENKAVFGNVFTTDQRLNETQITALKSQIATQYAGAANSGLPLILHSGLKLDRNLAQSASDLMLNEVSNLTRESLIATHDLSAGKVGLVKDVNRANMEGLDRTYYMECIKPKTMMIEEYFESKVLPLYDDRLTMDFDLPDVDDTMIKLQERRENLTNYVTTVNEERVKMGLPAVDWGDRPLAPFTIAPLQKDNPLSPRRDPEDDKTFYKVTMPEEWKVAYWNEFKINTEKWEYLVARFMRVYFQDQLKEIVDNLEENHKKFLGEVAGWSRTKVREHIARKSSTVAYNIDKAKAIKDLKERFEPVLKTILSIAGQNRFEQLNRLPIKAQMAIEFNVNDPKVKEWLGDRLDEFSKEITGTTFDDIDAILRESFQEGVGTSEVISRLSEKFESFELYRAQLIARTETIAASNYADLVAVEQFGATEKLVKHWLSSRDDRTRDTHLHVELATEKDGLDIDEEFIVGKDRMIAPGNGQIAKENINCRCTMYYGMKK